MKDHGFGRVFRFHWVSSDSGRLRRWVYKGSCYLGFGGFWGLRYRILGHRVILHPSVLYKTNGLLQGSAGASRVVQSFE